MHIASSLPYFSFSDFYRLSAFMKVTLLAILVLALCLVSTFSSVESYPIDTDLVSSPFVHQLKLRKGRLGTVRPQNARLEQ
jgi:hypothetical protein